MAALQPNPFGRYSAHPQLPAVKAPAKSGKPKLKLPAKKAAKLPAKKKTAKKQPPSDAAGQQLLASLAQALPPPRRS